MMENVKIKTVAFEIQEECDINAWYELFKKNADASDVELFLIEDHEISKYYNLKNILHEKYHTLNIQNNDLLTAY